MLTGSNLKRGAVCPVRRGTIYCSSKTVTTYSALSDSEEDGIKQFLLFAIRTGCDLDITKPRQDYLLEKNRSVPFSTDPHFLSNIAICCLT